MIHSSVKALLRWLILVSVPVVLTMALVRLLTMPWFPAWVYQRPGFPDDPFGMSSVERLRLARQTIRFLNTPWSTDLLEELRLPDGRLAYNERELVHMQDVKAVYNALTGLAFALLMLSVAAGLILARLGEDCAVWLALCQGGGLSLTILVSLGVWMVAGFDSFFTLFHDLFFEPGTWLFSYSDTLIRLFPIQLWQTAGFLVAGGVSFLSLVLLLAGAGRYRRCASCAST